MVPYWIVYFPCVLSTSAHPEKTPLQTSLRPSTSHAEVYTTSATLLHRVSPPQTQGDDIPIEDYPPLATHSQRHSIQHCKISSCAQRKRLRYATSLRSSTTYAEVRAIVVALHNRSSPSSTQDHDSATYIQKMT